MAEAFYACSVVVNRQERRQEELGKTYAFTWSQKRVVLFAIAFVLGYFGWHRLYARRYMSFAFTVGLLAIPQLRWMLILWYLTDLVLVATGRYKNGKGERI